MRKRRNNPHPWNYNTNYKVIRCSRECKPKIRKGLKIKARASNKELTMIISMIKGKTNA
jgi:hypothetical protein